MRLTLDIECYRNYFLAMFCTEDGKTKSFEMFNDGKGFDRQAMYKLMTHPDVELVTYNGINYDFPIIHLALAGRSNSEMKDASDAIIVEGLRSWQFYKHFDLNQMSCNHVDLIEVAPGMASLKIYGGRLHSKKLQDLPLDPSVLIQEDQLDLMRKYCKNDCMTTWDLYNELSPQIDLRRKMSQEYGTDLRSKSDAQIAEAVLKTEYKKITGDLPSKIEFSKGSFKYEPPAYIKFITPDLQKKFNAICNADIKIKPTGHVEMPDVIKNMKIKLGTSTYNLGIGGIHSQESTMVHKSNDTHVLIDRDVTSYYPNLMINMGMNPGGFEEHFIPIYKSILDRRIEAKRNKDSVTSDALKITLNGTFGKTANKYSTLYAPDMMLRITLTGQLSLLMLIEALEKLDIPVVSANTDGIVINCPRVKEPMLNKVITAWEKRTNLNTEETRYAALYARDVNNYIAVKEDGGVKTKGEYSKSGIWKNAQNDICSEAVIEYLTKGTSCAQTIRECRDITKFLTIRKVTGGAVKDGELLGKAVRWYYSTETETGIHYVKNNNVVAKSEFALPIMNLPEEFPDDIRYDWYIAEAESMLVDLGAIPPLTYEKVPRKNSKAWKELVANGDLREDIKGRWVWKEPYKHRSGGLFDGTASRGVSSAIQHLGHHEATMQ
jgi:DNA polymerase elongation subunit (family B)